jgi:hypothetical protein
MPDDELIGSALQDALRAVSRRPALYEVAAAVNQMVRSAVDLVPGADAGGISVESPGAGGAHGSTSGTAADLDALQHRHDEGPCLSALHGPPPERTVVVAQDLDGRDRGRWPQFASSAVEVGFSAVLALQLPAVAGVGAALNLYGRTAHGFGPGDLIMADTFVGHLAHLLFGESAAGRSRRPTEALEDAELRRRLRGPALEP